MKQKPNDKCECGSEQKYKKCCYIKDIKAMEEETKKYDEGHTPTINNNSIIDILKEEYKYHQVIDITNYLDIETYKKYQTRHYNSKVIMIAEKCENNQQIFETRGPMNNTIIMYRGSYRTFISGQYDQVASSIDKMIKTRLAGQDDK